MLPPMTPVYRDAAGYDTVFKATYRRRGVGPKCRLPRPHMWQTAATRRRRPLPPPSPPPSTCHRHGHWPPSPRRLLRPLRTTPPKIITSLPLATAITDFADSLVAAIVQGPAANVAQRPGEGVKTESPRWYMLFRSTRTQEMASNRRKWRDGCRP